MIVIRKSVWLAVQQYLVENPRYIHKRYRFSVSPNLIEYKFFIGDKTFLCSGSIGNPVAVVRIVGKETSVDDDTKVDDVRDGSFVLVLKILKHLSRSQSMNMREVFRYLL